MERPIKNNVSYIGKIDWELRKFYMAESIMEGLRKADPQVNLKLYNPLAKSDRNDVITEIFRSTAILVGSPTINRGVLTSIAALLEEMKGLKFRNKKAAAFGC